MKARCALMIAIGMVLSVVLIFLPLYECTAEDALQHSATYEEKKAAGMISIISSLLASSSAIPIPTPYVNEDNIAHIWNIYRESTGHLGIDFSPAVQLAPFQAVFSGVVEVLDLHQNEGTSLWHVNLKLVHDDVWSAWYAFEPMVEGQPYGIEQLWNMAVSEGDHVEVGDLLGRLKAVGPGSHVHFTLNKFDEPICPKAYFTPQARASIMEIIRKDNPDWDMCY